MILDEILDYKKEYIKTITLEGKRTRKSHCLKDYIKRDKINIIAEIKESSPSAGFIGRINLDEILPVYSEYACAVSVLTDEKFFGGSFDKLRYVADSVNLPILCKDFIIDEIQIDKAYLSGADMVLLIARLLSADRLKELYDYAKNMGLDILMEVHSSAELDKISNLKPDIVGVNSRDLDTLSISLERVKGILGNINFDAIKIAESGIKTKKDMDYLKDSCDGFLIGEVLMKNVDNLKEKFLEFIA